MLICKLESEDVALHAVSSEAQAALKKSQKWVKRIADSAHVMCWSFAILTHDIHITLNTSNRKMIIKKLMKDNARLHENLKMLKIAWFKKIVESEKIHSSLIVEIVIKTMTNRLLNMSMLDSYQDAHASCLKRTVILHSVTSASILIMWLDLAKMKNAASNVQTSITSKDALCRWIKDDAWTATIVMNFEDAHVSSENYR